MEFGSAINDHNSKNEMMIKNNAISDILDERSRLIVERDAEIEHAIREIMEKYEHKLAEIEESMTLMLSIGGMA